MNKLVDISGRRFGRLLALHDHWSKDGMVWWRLKCDCGNIVEVRANSLKAGSTRSCGCLVQRHDPERCRATAQAYRLRYRDKRKAQVRAWREANREHVLAYRTENRNLKYQKEQARLMADENARRKRTIQKYGLTAAQFNALLIKQEHRCAICRIENPIPVRGQRLTWHVDHDHITGKIRGLLCAHCNRGLGAFADDPVRLQAAIEYLACTADGAAGASAQRIVSAKEDAIKEQFVLPLTPAGAHRVEPLFTGAQES